LRQLHHEDQNWKYLKIGEPIKIKRNDAKFKTIKKLMEKLLTEPDNGKNTYYASKRRIIKEIL